jgi:hypothetical protein
MMERLSLELCVIGRVYKLDCRNLSYGVYDGKGGFIGIRTKFGSRFLDTELHWDADPHYGTVEAMEDLGIDVPIEVLSNDVALLAFLKKFRDAQA